MVRRHDRGVFGGLVVFPGGGVDDVDRSQLASDLVTGDSADQDHRAAALRELAEETGILATSRGVESSPDLRGRSLFEALHADGATLSGDSLVMVSRWVTPELAPRRFDTRFYLLAISTAPPVRLDPAELVDFSWITPKAALDKHESDDWPMILPTLAHLRWLARRSSVDEAIESAKGADGRTLIKPVRAEDGALIPVHLPDTTLGRAT
jgi:8-oxo-dGTP pyrophosphatase MutT (NUDIX family)